MLQLRLVFVCISFSLVACAEKDLPNPLENQCAIDTGDVLVSETGLNFETYAAEGISANPSSAQLDSSYFAVTGLSDGDIWFGDTAVSGDAARGVSNGGVNPGGLYAFDTGGNVVFGVQSTTADMTPGSIHYRIKNDSDDVLNMLNVAYRLYELNDKNRSTLIRFSYSIDGVSFVDLAENDYQSGVAADPVPQWDFVVREFQIQDLALDTGCAIELRWDFDDTGSGTGARDELGLDNITVSIPQ